MVSALLWLLASAGTVAIGVGTAFAWRRTRRPVSPTLPDAELCISVLKPMSGLDPRLEENLESFARLAVPPAFEVLLCVADEADPAFALAQRVATRFPARFRVVTGAASELGNAKMALLTHAWPTVRNSMVWVSDSNVEATQEHLHALVDTWKAANAAGRVKTLVHAPLVGLGGTGVGAALERMHLSSLQNPNHELALVLGLHAVVGKSLLFHREDLDALGGMVAFGQYLAEDYILGEAFARAGVVRCAPLATRNTLGHLTARAWFQRHARWAVLRKTVVGPAFYFVEPLSFLALPAALYAGGAIPGWLLAALTAGRLCIDGANYAVSARAPPRLADLALVAVKELLLFFAWVQALLTFHVRWRADRAIRLGPKSLVLSNTDNPSKLARHAEAVRRVLGRD